MTARRTRTTLQRLTAAGFACAVLGALVGAEAAQAATVVASPTAGSFYVPKKPRAACRAHYVKRTVIIRRRRHGKLVKVRQVRCVYASTKSSATPGRGGGSGGGSFPSNLPTGTVTVSVLPTVSGHTYGTTAGQALSVGGNGVLAGASGSDLSAILVSGPPSGSLTLNRNGSFSYTPAKGVSGIVRFAFKATSSNGESSTPATVTIKVAPVAADATYAVAAGGTLTIPSGGLLAGSVGSGLQTGLVSGPADGTLSLGADGSATYTAGNGFSGQDSFSYEVIDGSSLRSSAATVTLNVGAHVPAVVSQDFAGALPNTQLQVGAATGGPAVRILGRNALTGDSDPNGGYLSAVAGAIPTVDGGVVHMSASGDFTYDPPPGFTGTSDSFGYTVSESEGLTASAVATIDFTAAPRVWYVDDSAAAGGNGTSGSPFNSLAAAANIAGPTDVVYLAGGGAAYGGGIALGPNETLIGSGSSLIVAGTVVQGAVSPAPVVTNAGGVGITLSDGDSVAGLTVTGTSGDGIYAHNVGAFSLDASVTVRDAGGADVDIDGGAGAVSLGARLGGTAAHSLLVANRTGGTVTVAGSIGGSGGVLVQNDGGATIDFTGPITVSTGAQPAFTATGGGTVAATDPTSTLATTTARALQVFGGTVIGNAGLNFLSISAGTPSAGPDHGIYLNQVADAGQVELIVAGTLGITGPVAGSGGTIQNTTGDAVSLAGTTAAIQLAGMQIDNAGANGVEASDVAALGLDGLDISNAALGGVYFSGDGTLDRTVDFRDNAISGQPGAGIAVAVAGPGTHLTLGAVTHNTISSSSVGDGIDLTASSAAQLTLDVESNTLSSAGTGTGINALSVDGSTLELTLLSNGVTTSGQTGVAATETGTPGTLCVDPQRNVVASAANDLALAQQSAGGAFQVGGAWDGVSNLVTYLVGNNSLTNNPGATVLPNQSAFSAQSCSGIPSGLPV